MHGVTMKFTPIYVNKAEYMNEILPALPTVIWLNCFVTLHKVA